jgi:hypothetical protein
MPVMLATQEAEIRRIMVRSQPRQLVAETLSQKRAGGVAQGVSPEFKPQYCKNKKVIFKWLLDTQALAGTSDKRPTRIFGQGLLFK